MEPFEFVALTPKTNCKDCGQLSCLAFAVAVTKGGANPGLCPYIDVASLPEDVINQQKKDGLDRVEQGQQARDLTLVAHLKEKVSEIDFRMLASALGAEFLRDPIEHLRFSFLGRVVQLGKLSLTMEGKSLRDPRDQILLYNYVASGGGQTPDGNWVGMESLPSSISKVRTLETYCENKLANLFSGRPKRLLELCCQIGGKKNFQDQSATVAVIISVLPNIPIQLLFWDEEPDDGFVANVKVLFDHDVLDFLDLESLVFTAERLADHLMDLDQC